MINNLNVALVSLLVCHSAFAEGEKVSARLFEQLQWTPLNPLRGDESPQAADLWGNRQKGGATGFLVKFKPEFTSPPHIHNVSYRGVVIKGLVHNDDPEARDMWLSAGSFWTQPAGEAHITAAKDQENIAYIEIDSGPYLVHPKEQAFDNGEQAMNIASSNLVWLNASDIKWTDTKYKVQRAFLWGDTSVGNLNGSLIKLPVGFSGKLVSEGGTFHAVVISGQMRYESQNVPLKVGSYFGQSKAHRIKATQDTQIYIRTNSKIHIVEDKE
ncbi:DUF4437 domain-containing protein [Pseudoalteromonas luteoviolacea]|uniref:DUF4437 domain-containing protein n=1 Tax=Pseudoalteromonas luteoviolacea NCIMB 1942 TaxID=1365253 RepID=A0A166YCW7_9GAMM|nr:DUF4437 domain-containing protein [Pseudoalteromonas luteoviolacea]KZN42462.1 hypothetical protein N482_19650 [Pseudoalteromonas luteoviolacea NCIMB 1942]